MALTKDQILAANDVKAEAFDVPEWGGEINIRPITWADRVTLLAKRNDGHIDDITLIALCLVDDAGKTLFTLEDVAALQTKSHAVLMRVRDKVIAINGMSDDSKAKKEADEKKD